MKRLLIPKADDIRGSTSTGSWSVVVVGSASGVDVRCGPARRGFLVAVVVDKNGAGTTTGRSKPNMVLVNIYYDI